VLPSKLALVTHIINGSHPYPVALIQQQKYFERALTNLDAELQIDLDTDSSVHP
jgi:hypothetical protein